MKLKSDDTLVISLIKDDLINSKLVNGLNELGLNADNYFLHLKDTVFRLMGFGDDEDSEEVFKRYIELSNRALFIDISHSHKPLDDLALQIYIELSSRKPLS
jgi:hypothetical protein